MAGETGIMGGMSPQQMMMAQMLFSVGADVYSGNRAAPNTTQNFGNIMRNIAFMQMMQNIGGRGGKATIDGKGAKIEMPSEMMNEFMGGTQPGGQYEGLSPGWNPQPQQNQSQLMSKFLGGGTPEASPFLDVDWGKMPVTGITPQDYVIGINARMAQDKFKAEQAELVRKGQLDLPELMELMYKGQLSEESKARTSKLLKPDKIDPLDNLSPIEVPDVGAVSLRQWNALPNEEQRFAIAAHRAKKMGDTKFDRKTWEMLNPTDRERFLTHLKDDPELLKLEKDLKAAGAPKITIGEKMSEQSQLSKLAGQKYFDNPKWVDDVTKHIGSDAIRSELIMSDTPDQDRATEVIKYVRRKITGGGGRIIDYRLAEDGKTLIWNVQWSTGKTQEVSYEF